MPYLLSKVLTVSLVWKPWIPAWRLRLVSYSVFFVVHYETWTLARPASEHSLTALAVMHSIEICTWNYGQLLLPRLQTRGAMLSFVPSTIPYTVYWKVQYQRNSLKWHPNKSKDYSIFLILLLNWIQHKVAYNGTNVKL